MNDLSSHRAEFARAFRNHKFDVTDAGILFPQQGALLAGVMDVMHRNSKGELCGRDISPNIVCTEGLNHVLDTVLHGSAQITAWYVGLFEANSTPGATLTAATVADTLTESTAYAETTRVAYNEAAASAGVTTNSANRAEFTMNATKTIYGGFLASASAKSATTGTLLAAVKFSASRAVVSGDVLAVAYSLTLTSS